MDRPASITLMTHRPFLVPYDMLALFICACALLCVSVSAFRAYPRALTLTKPFVMPSTSGVISQDRSKFVLYNADEDEEYFESEFDRKPFKERLPAAAAFLAAVSLPFIIGLVYLYSNK